jgi:hypothetical protein
LKKLQPRTRVLAISGGGTYLRAHDVLNVARGFGAQGVLTKPFSRLQFLEAVRLVMETNATPAAASAPAPAPGTGEPVLPTG